MSDCSTCDLSKRLDASAVLAGQVAAGLVEIMRIAEVSSVDDEHLTVMGELAAAAALRLQDILRLAGIEVSDAS